MPVCEKESVVEVYSKIANHFSDTRTKQWPWITDYIKMITTTGDQYPLVLDIGCGNGRNMEGFRRDFVYGIDSCPQFVDICTERGFNVSVSDMTEIYYPNHVFDHMLCIAAFHHLSTEERRLKALREMRRVLKEGGTMLLSVWSIKQPPDTKQSKSITHYGDTMVAWDKFGEKYERYYYIFEVEELKRLFKQTAWTVIHHTWEYGNEVFILKKGNAV